MKFKRLSHKEAYSKYTITEINLRTIIKSTDVLKHWDSGKGELTYVEVPENYVGKDLCSWGNSVPRVFRLIPHSIDFIKG